MAPSASATARAHLLSELTRSRASSPYDDNAFTTATATSFRDAIHSTPQKQDWTGTQQLPLNYDEVPSPRSDDTIDLSIEMGRGVKRSARMQDDDVSSHAIFKLGDDNSRYDATATPMSARSGQRRSLGGLQKEASLRRALASSRGQDGQKKTVYGTKQRAVSDGLPAHNSDNDSVASKDNQNPTTTINIRASRFTSTRSVSQGQGIPSRFTSGQGLFDKEGTPMRTAANNPTIQSATYTANQSFMLPDLPNITELVAGVRKDGTPVFNRAGKSRSRFTSATYKPQPPSFAPVTSLPLPEDEKAIFASLQLLKDRITQLEAENSEAHKRAEEYVSEIIDLRSQLQVASRSPDSAIGSDDDTEGGKSSKATIARLQANVKATQDRLERAERKTSVAEITVKRVTNERDALITQIGSAYFCNEELTKENEIFRDSHGKLQAENEDLKAEIAELKADNERLRQKLGRVKASKAPNNASTLDAAVNTDAPVERAGQEQKEKARPRKVSAAPVAESQRMQEPEPSQSRTKDVRRPSQGQISSNDTQDLASRIEQEIMKYRQGIAAKPATARQTRSEVPRSSSARTRSKSQHRRDPEVEAPAGHKRTHSAPGLQADLSEGESTTTLDMTRASKREKSRERQQSRSETYHESRELTSLSPWHTEEILDLAAMRKKLEEELQSKKRASTQGLAGDDHTSRSGTHAAIPRKSSLKDLTGRFDQGTGRISLDDVMTLDQIKISKTVRVQSPHTSDAMSQVLHDDNDTGEISIMSNTSRRRRRALSAEGDTSAFIIPDITLHGSVPLPTNTAKNCIHHDVSHCTACAGVTGNISIPQPIPVSDRDLDLTNATIRPSQPPEIALANVIKHLEDEITHLKIQREAQNRLYNQHDPALSRRRRLDVKAKLDALTAEIEKRSDQVYSLYDVLEGQKQQAAQAAARGGSAAVAPMGEDELNETLTSIGIDPAELAGRVSRSAPSTVPAGLDGADDLSYVPSDDELPWEGLSDVESVESRM